MARQNGGAKAREWIQWAVGIFIVIYFAVDSRDISVFWLLLIGILIGANVLVEVARRTAGLDGKVEDEKPAKELDKPTATDEGATVTAPEPKFDLSAMTVEERLELAQQILEERRSHDES